MAVLYLKEQGSKIKKTGSRLIVEKEGQKLLDIPVYKMSSIVLFGNIQITSQSIKLFLNNQIDIVFMTYNGKHLGSLQAPKSKNIILRINQYRFALDYSF